MLNNPRQEKMKEFIRRNSSVTVQQLMEHFKVSDMTIRRDLVHLQKQEIIERVHGGAVYIKQEDETLTLRERSQKEEKQQIAAKAVSFIGEDSTVLLDSGSTTLEIAYELSKKRHLTVITNGLNIASFLSKNSNIEIVLLGGSVRHSTQSVVGPTTIDFLKQIRVDYSFIGVSALSLSRGLMNSNMVEGEVKQMMIKIAEKSYVVADHTKFEKNLIYSFAELDTIDYIITDTKLDQGIQKQFSDIKKPKIIIT